MSLALHFPVNLRMATELPGSDSILFSCTVSGVHHSFPKLCSVSPFDYSAKYSFWIAGFAP
jgi:hypothetical protein